MATGGSAKRYTMSAASPTPPTHHEIDPLSHALGELKAELRMLKWMVSIGFAVTWTALGGIYAMLFQLAGRLPP